MSKRNRKTETPAVVTETPAAPLSPMQTFETPAETTETPVEIAEMPVETPAAPRRGILATMLARPAGPRGRRKGEPTILTMPSLGENDTPFNVASILAFADDIYSGRTLTITTTTGETDEFLALQDDSLCLFPDLTPLDSRENAKRLALGIITRRNEGIEGKTHRIVVVNANARETLRALRCDRAATFAEKDAILKIRKNRSTGKTGETSLDATDVRGRITIANADQIRSWIALNGMTIA